jgi:hypothetical protein
VAILLLDEENALLLDLVGLSTRGILYRELRLRGHSSALSGPRVGLVTHQRGQLRLCLRRATNSLLLFHVDVDDAVGCRLYRVELLHQVFTWLQADVGRRLSLFALGHVALDRVAIVRDATTGS